MIFKRLLFFQDTMNYTILEKQLRVQLQKPLPGLEAQVKMSPRARIDEIFNVKSELPRKSAVLILLYPNQNSLFIPFIERAKNGGVHSGQISLPGGKFEDFDSDLSQTALREAEEEIGTDRHRIKILGSLTPLHIPVSRFMVYPFVGITDECPVFKPNRREVAKIIAVDVRQLLTAEINIEKITIHNTVIDAPTFAFNGTRIWGATSMILSEFRNVLAKVQF
jgi:8-oxo-dGTP pyrophosphatase MutT (NUDIX family)